MRPISSGKTDRGGRRLKNEDSIGVFDNLGLYVVADGMGGHAAGDVASRTAVEAVRARVKTSATITVNDVSDEADAGQRLLEAVDFANKEVLKKASSDPLLKGMGTTIAAVLLDRLTGIEGEGGEEAGARGRPTGLALAHVGDSRIYLFRNGELSRLTRDHSLVEDLVAEGRITPGQARVHPFRNVVTRALGTKEDVQADISRLVPEPGDMLLLCSDGLTGMLEDLKIAEIMALGAGSPFVCADVLVRAANKAGGDDNISAVVLKF